MKKKKVLLAILDGWGKGIDKNADAIQAADTPFYDHLISKYPNANLVTFGSDVGLPDGQMGNSEVGHLNIGAGRIVYQELARINKAIAEETLIKQPILQNAIEYALQNSKPIHILGLLSDGGVHSHINHIIALSEGLAKSGISDIRIHGFMDGRDTDPQGGKAYTETLLSRIKGSANLVSLVGRYYAMDRDLRWERIKKAYDLLVHGQGTESSDAVKSLQNSYDENITDEFINPIILDKDKIIRPGDVVLFANFRTDRPRQLTRALTQENFIEHSMKKLDLHYVTMTKYDASFEGINVVFEKDELKNTLGEIICKNGLKQVRIAETEKYPHVTFFFNGGREAPFEGEERIMIPSPKVATYDLKPEMSAIEVTDAITQSIEMNAPEFICLNYANADMVGHTGDFEAAKVAVQTVDSCLKRLVETALHKNYDIIVIADHGNSDYMINADGSPNTAHTTNLVPVIYVSNNGEVRSIKNGKLADIAPTILKIMNIHTPEEMDGEILIGQ